VLCAAAKDGDIDNGFSKWRSDSRTYQEEQTCQEIIEEMFAQAIRTSGAFSFEEYCSITENFGGKDG
jgi:hypothetical protein